MSEASIKAKYGRWNIKDTGWTRSVGARIYNAADCQCDCGSRRVIRLDQLKGGQSKSCGCLTRDVAAARATIHGATKSRLHNLWCGMRARCNKPTRRGYSEYGGRGIKVCSRWEDFECFRRDIGEPPSTKHSLDRIDVNGNYEPGNVRWATSAEQNANKRDNIFTVINGEKLCLKEACRRVGIKYPTVQGRMSRGWSLEAALHTPAGPDPKANYRRKLYEFMRRP